MDKNKEVLIEETEMLKDIITKLDRELQIKGEEVDILTDKLVSYLAQIEVLVHENEGMKIKRQALLDRTEELYGNNQKLVQELKDIKSKYRALRGSKLGKVTMFIWRLKKKLKQR